MTRMVIITNFPIYIKTPPRTTLKASQYMVKPSYFTCKVEIVLKSTTP